MTHTAVYLRPNPPLFFFLSLSLSPSFLLHSLFLHLSPSLTLSLSASLSFLLCLLFLSAFSFSFCPRLSLSSLCFLTICLFFFTHSSTLYLCLSPLSCSLLYLFNCLALQFSSILSPPLLSLSPTFISPYFSPLLTLSLSAFGLSLHPLFFPFLLTTRPFLHLYFCLSIVMLFPPSLTDCLSLFLRSPGTNYPSAI